jgi:hypothetical protein
VSIRVHPWLIKIPAQTFQSRREIIDVTRFDPSFHVRMNRGKSFSTHASDNPTMDWGSPAEWAELGLELVSSLLESAVDLLL